MGDNCSFVCLALFVLSDTDFDGFLLFQTQFILVTVHSIQLLFIDCDYPTLFVYWILAYAVIFLVMFADFYRNAYKKPKTNGAVANGLTAKAN